MKQLLIILLLLVVNSSLFAEGQILVETFNNKTYLIYVTHDDWETAKQKCINHGMSLMTVNNQSEFNFIKSKLTDGYDYWIGLNDIDSEGNYVWTNDSTEYRQWLNNEPSYGDERENCVNMSSTYSYLWKDDNCNISMSFVCESYDEHYDHDLDGVTVANGDCDDNNIFKSPNMTEYCNNIDDNCNINIDEDCVGDCFDDTTDILPGIIEYCDYMDNNCDGNVDEGCNVDADEDSYTIGMGDCNDNNNQINPSKRDICNNIDDNCNNHIDEDCNPTDFDDDYISNENDNCPLIANQRQENFDNDEFGDVCDNDDDNDSIDDLIDNCPFVSNTNQEDTDNDGIGNICDNCIAVANIDQLNNDGGLIKTFNVKTIDNINIQFLFDIEKDSNGNIYVSDLMNNRVMKFDSNGIYISKTDIQAPMGIEIDSNNNIYIMENSTAKVKKFDSDFVSLSEFLTHAGEQKAYNILLKDNNIYVSSFSSVYKYDLTGSLLTNWSISSNRCPGIVVDSQNNVYVSDAENNKIVKYNQEGSVVLEWGTLGNRTGEFNNPFKLIIDSENNIYVSDANNNRIQKFTQNGVFIEEIKSNTNQINSLISFDLTNNGIFISDGNGLTKYVFGDKLGNACDNCINMTNENQIDTDDDGLGDLCDDNYCSVNQPFGQCPEQEVCDNGICVDALYQCSENHQNGYCEAGKVCNNGVCVNYNGACSTENPTGSCQAGKVCDNGICVEIIYSCSLNHPAGVCEAGKECVEGNCVDIINQCSSEYITGYCSDGKICDNGTCVDAIYACSPSHLDGLCLTGYECKDGFCVILNNNNNSGGSDDGCSFSGTETRQCLVSTEIILLFIMMIGLLIKRKYN